MSKIRQSILILACITVMACGSSSTSSSTAAWAFTDDTELSLSGVSPESIQLSDGTILLYLTGGDGMVVYSSTDALTFSSVTASTPAGADPSIVSVSGGTYRMYYTAGSPKTILTATSPDALAWTAETSTGISNTLGGNAWGVPDSVVTPEGLVRLYWVARVEQGGLEVIESAISSDGTSFTTESGYRTENGYVDPYVLSAEDGNWLALFSTTPANLPQQIYVGTSTDGLTWTIESSPIITVSGGNALDPCGISLGNGSYRIYYIASRSTDVSSDYYVRTGILSR